MIGRTWWAQSSMPDCRVEWKPKNGANRRIESSRNTLYGFLNTEQNLEDVLLGMTHPYVELEGTPIWIVVEATIDDLVRKNDLVENTTRDYIVGYFCRKILAERKSVFEQLEQT